MKSPSKDVLMSMTTVLIIVISICLGLFALSALDD